MKICACTSVACTDAIATSNDLKTAYTVYCRVSGSTLTAVARSQLLARWPGSQYRILFVTLFSASIYFKTYLFARFTVTSSALGVALYKSTHALTHCVYNVVESGGETRGHQGRN